MKWTSEFQPPPPRPNTEADNRAEIGFDVIEHADQTCAAGDDEPSTVEGRDSIDDEADLDLDRDGDRDLDREGDGEGFEHDEVWTDVSNTVAIPDEGPLDPSIFDGLFDDLTSSSDRDEADAEQDEVDDEPSPIGAEADEVEAAEFALESALPVEPAPPLEPAPPVEPKPRRDAGDRPSADYRDEEIDVDTDLDPIDGELIEQAFDPETTLFGLEVEPAANVDSGPSNSTVDITQVAAELGHVPEHPLEQPKVVIEAEAKVGGENKEAVEAEAQPVLEAGQDPPRATEPALLPQIQSDHGPRPSPAEELPAADQQPSPAAPTGDVDEAGGAEQPTIRHGTAAPERRWPAFAIATLIGAGFGIGGALVLSQIVNRSDDGASSSVTQPASQQQTEIPQDSPATDPAADAAAEQAETGATEPVDIAGLVAGGRLELNAVRFVPGTTNLTDGSVTTLSELAAATVEQPDEPFSIVVRTYSEQTAAENRVLSESQAEVIADYLVGLGLPETSVNAQGVGAPPLSLSQPVQNFVVVNSGLQPSALRTTLQGLSPFAIGLDPVTNQLRPESVETLNIVGQAMASDGERSISLAAYSYGEADASSNQDLAGVAAEAVAAFLTTNHQIDQSRVSTLTPGQAPYIVSAAAGNHISLQWGEPARLPAGISGLDLTAIAFAAGSAQLSAEAQAELARLAELTGATDLSLVIEIHTATENSDDANARLGQRQADAIRAHLAAEGIAEERLRVYGSGNLRQFRDSDQPSLVTITAIP